jgi:hypothetical protein
LIDCCRQVRTNPSIYGLFDELFDEMRRIQVLAHAMLRKQHVFERHQLKGAKAQGFSEVLSGLDLRHPPFKELIAKQAFYAIATLAYNVLISLKMLDLPDDAQGWRIQTIIRYLLTVPVSVSTHARYDVARLCIPGGLAALEAALCRAMGAQAQTRSSADRGGGLGVEKDVNSTDQQSSRSRRAQGETSPEAIPDSAQG